MGTYVVKITRDAEHWYKLVDQQNNLDFDGIMLDEAVSYDPNNTEADQWFKIDCFDEKEGFLPLLDQDFDSADLPSLTSDQFTSHKIDFIAYYNNHRYYMQKFTKGNFMKKKWLAWRGDAVEYFEEDGLIYINPTPNCIYDNRTKCIYFMDISKAYSIFGNLKLDYKEATEEETTRILQSDLIRTNNFNAEDVGVSNRKRITSVLTKYENYNPKEKKKLQKYIRDIVGANLPFDKDSQKFIISNDTQLRLLLYGIQQRFYQPPLESEVQVATAITKISNLL